MGCGANHAWNLTSCLPPHKRSVWLKLGEAPGDRRVLSLKGRPPAQHVPWYMPKPGFWTAAQPGRESVEDDEGYQCTDRGLGDQLPPTQSPTSTPTPAATYSLNQPPSYPTHVLQGADYVFPTV